MTRRVIVKDVQAEVADIEHYLAFRIGPKLDGLRARLGRFEARIAAIERRAYEKSEYVEDRRALAELAEEAGAIGWIEDNGEVAAWVMPDGTRKTVRKAAKGWRRDRCNACGTDRWVYQDSGKCVQCDQREASA